MCGVVGLLHPLDQTEPDLTALRRMAEAIRRRGRDGD